MLISKSMRLEQNTEEDFYFLNPDSLDICVIFCHDLFQSICENKMCFMIIMFSRYANSVCVCVCVCVCVIDRSTPDLGSPNSKSIK